MKSPSENSLFSRRPASTQEGIPSSPGTILTEVYAGISSETRSACVRSSNDWRTFATTRPFSFDPAWITPMRYFTYPETGRSPAPLTGPRTRYTPRSWPSGISLPSERYTVSPSTNPTFGSCPPTMFPIPLGLSFMNSPARTKSAGLMSRYGTLGGGAGGAAGGTAGFTSSTGRAGSARPAAGRPRLLRERDLLRPRGDDHDLDARVDVVRVGEEAVALPDIRPFPGGTEVFRGKIPEGVPRDHRMDDPLGGFRRLGLGLLRKRLDREEEQHAQHRQRHPIHRRTPHRTHPVSPPERRDIQYVSVNRPRIFKEITCRPPRSQAHLSETLCFGAHGGFHDHTFPAHRRRRNTSRFP